MSGLKIIYGFPDCINTHGRFLCMHPIVIHCKSGIRLREKLLNEEKYVIINCWRYAFGLRWKGSRYLMFSLVKQSTIRKCFSPLSLAVHKRFNWANIKPNLPVLSQQNSTFISLFCYLVWFRFPCTSREIANSRSKLLVDGTYIHRAFARWCKSPSSDTITAGD